jgi:dUTP pyrophosphatase
MDIKIKKMNKFAKTPTRGSEYAAGYDLYAASGYCVFIEPHKTVMVGTGIAMEIPKGYFGAIFARSGLASKRGLRPANCVGVVDCDYRNEVMVALHNDTDEVVGIEPQERIAQLVILPYVDLEFFETDNLSDTERGLGGFGSTGTK